MNNSQTQPQVLAQTLSQVEVKIMSSATTNLVTARLLATDRDRATDILLQLKFQLSRNVSSTEVK